MTHTRIAESPTTAAPACRKRGPAALAGLSLFVLCLAALPEVAQAGWSFTPAPADVPQPPTPAAIAAMPPATSYVAPVTLPPGAVPVTAAPLSGVIKPGVVKPGQIKSTSTTTVVTQQAALLTGTGLIQQGTPHPTACTGFSTGLPLGTAAKLIVPTGWTVAFAAGAPLDYELSWACGSDGSASPWTTVLAHMMRQSQAVALVNWNTNKVSIGPAGDTAAVLAGAAPVAGAAPAITTVTRTTTTVATSTTPQSLQPASLDHPVVAALPLPAPVYSPPAPSPQMVWTLDSQTRISSDLEDWAAKAGWHVYWDIKTKDNRNVNWFVPATATYNGSFRKAVGAVVQDMADEKPGAGIRVDVYPPNHFVRIYNQYPINDKK